MTNFTVMNDDAAELLGKQIDELTGKVDALIRQRDALAEENRRLKVGLIGRWPNTPNCEDFDFRFVPNHAGGCFGVHLTGKQFAIYIEDDEMWHFISCADRLWMSDLKTQLDAAMQAQSERALDELAADAQRLGLGY